MTGNFKTAAMAMARLTVMVTVTVEMVLQPPRMMTTLPARAANPTVTGLSRTLTCLEEMQILMATVMVRVTMGLQQLHIVMAIGRFQLMATATAIFTAMIMSMVIAWLRPWSQPQPQLWPQLRRSTHGQLPAV